MTKQKAKVSAIIITLNEEENIEQCLQSVYGWSDDIHIADSNSTDNTVEIAKKYTGNIHTVEKGHWANLRNWAMLNIRLKYEWVIFVDADEWLTKELKNEITQKTDSDIEENGFYIRRRFIFLNKWLKHGGYGQEVRLLKHEKTRFFEAGDVVQIKVDGKVGILKNDMVHQDLKSFSTWVDKHNRISLMAAERYIEKKGKITDKFRTGSWLGKIWNKIPLLLRPFFWFFYVYFIKLGFLDGKEGFIYYVHHEIWYPLLIYTKIKEIEIRQVQRRKLL